MKIDGQGQAEVLSPDELNLLLDHAPCERSKALFTVMIFSGSRISESLLLRWGAIQDSQLIFKRETTKTKTSREILLHERVVNELKIYKQYWIDRYKKLPTSRDFLFVGRFGFSEPLTRQWGHKCWHKAVKEAGLKAGTSCHSPRRSLATRMHSKGIGLKTIASFTGHQSLDQLSTYISVDLKEKQKALDVLT
jgi:integrase/recombinase XerD